MGVILFTQIIVAILILYGVFITVGYLTLFCWTFNTEWGHRNVVSIFTEKDLRKLVKIGFLSGLIGFLTFIPILLVATSVQSVVQFDIYVEPYVSITRPLSLGVLALTILGPLPLRLLQHWWNSNMENRGRKKTEIKNSKHT